MCYLPAPNGKLDVFDRPFGLTSGLSSSFVALSTAICVVVVVADVVLMVFDVAVASVQVVAPTVVGAFRKSSI